MPLGNFPQIHFKISELSAFTGLKSSVNFVFCDIFLTVNGRVPKFCNFMNRHKTYCSKKIKALRQLPDWRDTAWKSLIDVIFLWFLFKKKTLLYFNHTVKLWLWFFVETCLKTVEDNSQNLETQPLTVFKNRKKTDLA